MVSGDYDNTINSVKVLNKVKGNFQEKMAVSWSVNDKSTIRRLEISYDGGCICKSGI